MIFPTLFLTYFTGVLTMIMTSVRAIFLFISASLLVYVKYSCVIYMLKDIVKRARLLSSHSQIPLSFHPSSLPWYQRIYRVTYHH